MSKKLIAVASAAALALSALVGVGPAHATPTIEYKTTGSAVAAGTTAGTGGGTEASPYLIAVPAGNALVNSGGATVVTVLEVAVSTVAAGDKITVNTTGPVRAVDELFALSQFASVLTAGKTSYTYTMDTGEETKSVYLYTTSTTAGTFTISVEKTTAGVKTTSSATKVVKGVAGSAYTLAVTVPSSAAVGVEQEILITAKDAFGNAINESSALESSLSAADAKTAGVGTAPTVSAFTWTAARNAYRATFTATSTAPFAYILDHAGSSVAGLGSASTKGIFNVNGTSASAVSEQVATLTAQIATMRPKATSVTKKKYNTLARKWNAAFPSQKVALKK